MTHIKFGKAMGKYTLISRQWANKACTRRWGSLRQSQAVFYAFSFFQLDGFAVPAPARVTQAVETVEKVGDFNNQIYASGFYTTIEEPYGKIQTNQ